MLLPSASEARHRVLAGKLHRGFARGWVWLRPRSVPVIVAFAGFLAVLGATKYLSVYACGNDPVIRAPAGPPGTLADGLATRDPALPGSSAPLLPRAECGMFGQTLPGNWLGHTHRLHLRSHTESPVESPLHLTDGCLLAPVRVR
jgi:hypothetical protein